MMSVLPASLKRPSSDFGTHTVELGSAAPLLAAHLAFRQGSGEAAKHTAKPTKNPSLSLSLS